MQTLVIGCGTIGSTIAAMLCAEGHNVTALDIDRDSVQNISDRMDVMGYCADCTNLKDLTEAGIKNTDLVIAVTDNDEKNFLTCMIAKKAGGCQTICRISNDVSAGNAHFLHEEMGLSMMINPRYAAAQSIARMLKYPAAISVETFANGRLELSRYKVAENSVLVGIPLKDIGSRTRCNVLICTVERGEEFFIPRGDFVLQKGDIISVVADNINIMQFMKNVGMDTDPVKSVIIVGGSSTAEYLAKMLLDINIDVTLIENDIKRCEELSFKLTKASIVHDDGTDHDTLMEEGITSCDAFVALTNRDEENILLSLYVKSVSNVKVISRIHHLVYDDFIERFDIGSVIVPRDIVGNMVLRYVRAMNNSLDSNVETLYRLAQGKAEALEFIIKGATGITAVPIRELNLKPRLIIAAIIRKDKVIIPGGNDVIQTDDRVIVITMQKGLDEIGDILR